MSEKQAIIDLGSNTTRMLVMEVLDNGAYRLAEEAKYSIRLAEHMAPDGAIKPPALARAVEAMTFFRSIIDYHGVTKIDAAATAAVRDAANQAAFLRELEGRTGIRFRVLSREEEAYYGYLGVINSTDARDGIVFDLGGGSMEITALKNRQIAATASLPVGSASLTERFLGTGRPSEKQIAALEDYVKSQLKSLDWLEGYRNSEVIGVGGTARTIARVHQRLVNYPFDEIHNYSMPPEEITFIYNNLRTVGLEDRKAVQGLSKDRADIIVAGMATVVALLKQLKAPRMRVSSWGLRDGIFYSGFVKGGVVDDPFAFSIDNIQRLYSLDRPHASRVATLATSLFDQLKDVHRAGDEKRRLLWAAAMLHEAGYFYDYHNRYNHTFYNIVNGNVFGVSEIEVYEIAVVAALYGAGGIKGRDSYIDMLPKEENRTLKKLSVLLALADALDRSRKWLTLHVSVSVAKDSVHVKPAFAENGWIERRTAEGVALYFSKAFDRDLIIDGPEAE